MEWTLAILPVVVIESINWSEIAIESFGFINHFVNTQLSFSRRKHLLGLSHLIYCSIHWSIPPTPQWLEWIFKRIKRSHWYCSHLSRLSQWMQCLMLTEEIYEINYKLNYNYNPCFNRNNKIHFSHIRHILMVEAFSTVLNLKSKLFISFVHVNQQRALKTDHTGNIFGIFVGGLGMEASMIHSHPHAGP